MRILLSTSLLKHRERMRPGYAPANTPAATPAFMRKSRLVLELLIAASDRELVTLKGHQKLFGFLDNLVMAYGRSDPNVAKRVW
jgi:hypothetical protein